MTRELQVASNIHDTNHYPVECWPVFWHCLMYESRNVCGLVGLSLFFPLAQPVFTFWCEMPGATGMRKLAVNLECYFPGSVYLLYWNWSLWDLEAHQDLQGSHLSLPLRCWYCVRISPCLPFSHGFCGWHLGLYAWSKSTLLTSHLFSPSLSKNGLHFDHASWWTWYQAKGLV